MKLGIINWIYEEHFKDVSDKGLEYLEICVNDRDKEFLENVEKTKELSEKYNIKISSVGRWGSDRILKTGELNDEELSIEYKLIDACQKLDAPVYVTGCNYVEEFSYYENVTFAIKYFEKLIEYAKPKNIKIATYNCRWNNFVHSDPAWNLIHGYLKDLYIKYDTSHCIYDGGDYLSETKKWCNRFAHVHIKGVLVVDGQRYDDPPAGLDQTDWSSFIGMLYSGGYDGVLSIEPHSPLWQGELGRKGIEYTIRYIKKFML
ncbi:sugar phosphate isomerase/epimerase [uncultured Tyzzerella sp.]|uniref:sugar phosphate isomerase/epimerase family protein n=1 Tax=uncultured Tyzzerella sp. TaxID=2321398 RepID=UPI00294225E6|nr:sugar phosphate isomerase/epimerase [uncultured Tyzzerella sp.]